MNIEGWNNSASPSEYVDLHAAEQGFITRCRDAENQDSWLGTKETLAIWEKTLNEAEGALLGFIKDGYTPFNLTFIIKSSRETIKIRRIVNS